MRTWSVTILIEHSSYKESFTQRADPQALYEHLKKKYPGGIYHAVYESGFSGYSSCYDLRDLGVDCIITHAADVPTSQKERLTKTDKVDSVKLARELRNQSLKAIYVPSKEVLGDREMMRLRQTIMKDLSRTKCRIKHMLHTNGVSITEQFMNPRTHWSRAFIKWLREDVKLLSSNRFALDMLIKELLHHRQLLLETNKAIRNLSKTERYKRIMTIS